MATGVCGMRESEPLWKAGRGFVVRDLPWTVEKLRELPPFEFENWAVIALGGIPNKTQVGTLTIAQRFSAGSPRQTNQPSPVRDGRTVLSSLAGLSIPLTPFTQH